jgi:hypothetical protein
VRVHPVVVGCGVANKDAIREATFSTIFGATFPPDVSTEKSQDIAVSEKIDVSSSSKATFRGRGR